jgi:signal transduction histidine kinase
MNEPPTVATANGIDAAVFWVLQEVHDIVGHGLAAIKVQADVALHLLTDRPEQAQVALDAISRTSGAALNELRATLAVVRRTGDGATVSSAPGLARLEELRDRMNEAGLRVRLDIAGEARALPAAVDMTGYRIVQESLTNVLRHSTADHATVTVRYETDALVLTVSNPLDPPHTASGSGSGLGIPGMRKRTLAVGGEFSAGPVADGGSQIFRVRARLPVTDRARRPDPL